MRSPLGQKGKQAQTLNHLMIFRKTYHCWRSQWWDERMRLSLLDEWWKLEVWIENGFYPMRCFWENGATGACLPRHSATLLLFVRLWFNKIWWEEAEKIWVLRVWEQSVSFVPLVCNYDHNYVCCNYSYSHLKLLFLLPEPNHTETSGVKILIYFWNNRHIHGGSKQLSNVAGQCRCCLRAFGKPQNELGMRACTFTICRPCVWATTVLRKKASLAHF